MGSYWTSNQEDESDEQSDNDFITPMHSNNNNKNNTNNASKSSNASNNNINYMPGAQSSKVLLGEKHKRQNQSDIHEQQDNLDNRNKIRKIDLDPQRMILSQHNMNHNKFSEL